MPAQFKEFYPSTRVYFGLVTSSIFTGIGSFLDFAGTPHFLGSEVELGPPLFPWVARALLMSSTANINAAVWLQAELPATQVQLPWIICPFVLLTAIAVLYAPAFCEGNTVARMMQYTEVLNW